MKKNKIVFTICAIIVFIIFLEIVLYIKKGIEISKLNNMYTDISDLENRVALYYLDYGKLPIVKDKEIEFKDKSINPNDNEKYYEIDLNLLESLNLFYGEKEAGNNDIYIINQQSHTIYYLVGCQYDERKIYTKDVKYQYVNLDEY